MSNSLTALVAVAAVIVAIFALVHASHVQSSNRAQLNGAAVRRVVAVAKRDAVDLSTYSAASLRQDWAKVEQESTTAFAKQFKQTSNPVGGLFTRYDASARGTIAQAAPISVSGSKAQVLVLVDQTAFSSASPAPQKYSEAMVETLLNQKGKWLLDKLDIVH